jgi:DNA-binding PadR family transcriptional regulator
MRGLSELEGTVLGHLERHGPSTAYAVRREFLLSPSTHWSGSAGAVYPLLARLENAGAVRSKRTAQGDRKATLYSLTEKGRRRFLAWLEPPFSFEAISLPPDPLRTRVQFLAALPQARRLRMLDDALRRLAVHLAEIEALETRDAYERSGIDGGIAVMRTRIEWVSSLRDDLARFKEPRRARSAPPKRARRRTGA